MQNKKYDTISFGLFILFVGVVSLLINTNYTSFGAIVDFVLKYWPIFIIAGGVKMLIEAQSGNKLFGVIFDLLLDVVIIAFLLFGHKVPALQQQPSEEKNDIQQTTVNQSQFPSVKSKIIDLTFGATDLTVSESDSSDLLTVSGPQDTYTLSTFENNGAANVSVVNNKAMKELRFNRSFDKFSVSLGALALPTDLNLTLGASEGALMLRQTTLNELNISLGAGTLEAYLSENALAKSITAKVGAGKLSLTLPKDTSIRVSYGVGAGSLKVIKDGENGTQEFGGIGTNGVYETSAMPKVIIDASVGVGSMEIHLK